MKRLISSFIFSILFFNLSFGQHANDNSISYFLIDGLSNKVFKRLLNDNKLPTIDSLISSGLYVENGIVSFPSITGFSYYPYLTGVDGADSGIFGLRWFDRNLNEGNLRNYVGRTNVYMNQDIRPDIKTIFDINPNEYTATINSFMNRGAQESLKTGWMFTTAKYGEDHLFGKLRTIPLLGSHIGQNHIEHESNVLEKALAQLGKNPKVHWVTFASPDAYHHIQGMDSEYDQLLIHIDFLIGKYIEKSKKLGHFNRHYAIISDHGVADVQRNIDPCKSMEKDLNLHIERGIPTELWKGRLDRPLIDMKDKNGYFAINGNLAAFIYMTDGNLSFPDNWRKRLYYSQLKEYGANKTDLLQYLSQLEGVELVVCSQSTHQHWVYNNRSKALITTLGDSIKYQVFSDQDPLHYQMYSETNTLIKQGWQHESIWQQVSVSTGYPDALYRISALMNKPNSPDIVICSLPEYDFGKDYEIFVNNYKGGHGGLRDEMINVPFVLSGPNVNKEQILIMRSEDLGKRILELMK